jgi:hypothetical protein
MLDNSCESSLRNDFDEITQIYPQWVLLTENYTTIHFNDRGLLLESNAYWFSVVQLFCRKHEIGHLGAWLTATNIAI